MSKTARSSRFVPARFEPLERRKLLAAGDLDSAFSGDGKFELTFPGENFDARDVAMWYAEGKVVVVGMKGDQAAAARINPDGTLDTSFADGGVWQWSRTAEQGNMDEVRGVAIQGDGKIVVVGESSAFAGVGEPRERRFAVARLLANGYPDYDFGDSGVAKTDIEDDEQGNDVLIQRDGKIVAVGAARTGFFDVNFDMVIVRYNTNGSLDSGFGSGGIKVVGFGDDEYAYSVAIDYNGTAGSNPWYGYIVAAGSIGFDPSRFAVARLRTDGALDNGFDGDGKLASGFPGGSHPSGRAVTIQPTGKIVVAGNVSGSPGGSDFGLIRYHVNGAIDNAFGPNGNGSVRTDFGGSDVPYSVAASYNGGLIVAGAFAHAPNGVIDTQQAIAAYTSEGRLDPRFSGDGKLLVDYNGPIGSVGIATTENFTAPARRLIIAGGLGVTRMVDVGPVVSVTSFDQNAAEQGQDVGTFVVYRDELKATPLRVYIGVSGRATPPGVLPPRPRDYNGTGINFGNGQTSTTYVDIPANEAFAFVTITPVDDTTIEGDETAIFSVGNHALYDAGMQPSETLIIRDNDAIGGPTVMAADFLYQTAPQRVQFTFNQDVDDSIGASDFQLTGPPGMPAHTFSYQQLTNTVTLTFAGIVPDGQYTARAVASGIANAAGQPMPADHVLNFFFLQGDANHDGRVNLQDFNVLAANFGQSPRNFTQGDFNYDNKVNLSDFAILAGRFGASVAPHTDASGGDANDDADQASLRERLSDLLT